LRTQDSQEPPVKKLAIREEPSEEEKYDFVTQVRLYSGGEGDRSQAQYVAVDEVDEKVSRTRLCPVRV
jgi:ubiquitin carboxyl-terminal hydrolase 5/13